MMNRDGFVETVEGGLLLTAVVLILPVLLLFWSIGRVSKWMGLGDWLTRGGGPEVDQSPPPPRRS